jgi:cell division transport system ATP-binding protein
MSNADRRPSPAASPVARLIGAADLRVKGAGRADSVDLTMPRGSFHFITGPAGAGKSALLSTLALRRPPERGAVEAFGVDPWSIDETGRAGLRRRIGAALSHDAPIDRLTVFQNAALPLVLAGAPAERRGDVAEMLDWLGLSAVAYFAAGALDRARRRALIVARALVAQPELIVIDDPFDDLEPETGGRVMSLLAALGQGEAAVVMAGRDPAPARKAGAEVLTLRAAT